MKFDWEKMVKIYLIIVGIVILIYSSVNAPIPIGEWDDYSLPVASIISEHSFSISEKDIIIYKEIFPEWSDYIEHYELSPYKTKAGKEMTWYFPVYSIVCIPFVLLLNLLRIPTIYAFPYTNLALLMVALSVIWRYLNVNVKRKMLLIAVLSINPIVFYTNWASAEMFIYSLLIVTFVFWYNRWYKRAAVFVSVAGMMNPTIMITGIIMIVEYMVIVLKTKKKSVGWKDFIRSNWRKVFAYGCCYVISLIPMLYNYYNIGYINLTASLSGFTQGKESTLARFISYLFDLNYGIFPYFPILLIVAIVMIIPAILHKHWRYLEWICVFALNVLLYSIMTHINCGMSGIARYNTWGSLSLLFSVCLFFDEILYTKRIIRIVKKAFIVSICITGVIVFWYGPNIASNTHSSYYTPMAEWMLDNAPSLYNPLYSTFSVRTTHKERYNYGLPIVYTAKDGYCRKILATKENINELKQKYISISGAEDWLNNQFDKLTEKEMYISIPKKYQVIKCVSYKVGESILFDSQNGNSSQYVISGLYTAEDWGSWTSGEMLKISLRTDSDCAVFHSIIDCSIFNKSQKVQIYVNDERVYDFVITDGPIEFDFRNPGADKKIDIRLEFPEANSPADLGQSSDSRVLALGIREMVINCN